MSAVTLKKKIKYDVAVHGGGFSLPPQFVSDSVKETDAWKEACMDYFDHQANGQISTRYDDAKKLDYLAGKIDKSAYRKSAQVLLMTPKTKENNGQPATDVSLDNFTHYPIMIRPINTIIGEYIKRIAQLHGFYIKNESNYARNEHNRVKAEMLQNWATQKLMANVAKKVKASGVKEGTPEYDQAVQQQTPEDIQDFMDRDYTDIAETVNSTMLKNMWKSESLDSEFIEGFKSACTLNKEFFHIYRINKKTRIKNLSSQDCFWQKSPSNKWISEGQYAGFRSWYTPSSIIDMFYDDLTEEDFLQIEAFINPNAKKDDKSGKTGINSIGYDTNTFADFAGNPSGYMNMTSDMIREYQTYGHSDYYTNTQGLVKMVRAYWKSYRKIGWLTSYGPNDEEIIELVDDNYTPDASKGEYVKYFPQNQIYTGAKILNDIYKDIRPYNDQIVDMDNLEYNPLPIEGWVGEGSSLFDLMLPWNQMYDIIARELEEDINSSIGKAMFMSTDHIPNIPGFDMNKWYYWVKKFKIAWVKQPKNGPNTFNQFSAVDMSFAQQMVAKMEILDKIMMNCDSFAGFAPGRIVGQSSEQTLGQSSQQLAASVNQTEYLFFKHSKLIERVLNQALNLSRKNLKENTFIRNLFDDYQLSYVDYDPDIILNARVGLFVTNSAEDLRKRQQMETLMQPAMQNGADFTDLSEMIMAETLSEVRTLGHKLRRTAKANLQAQQEQSKAEMEKHDAQIKLHEDNFLTISREKMRSAEKQAYIRTFGGVNASPEDDADTSGVPDVLEYDKFDAMQQDLFKKHSLALRKQAFDEKKHADTMALDKDKLKAEKARTAAMASRSRSSK